MVIGIFGGMKLEAKAVNIIIDVGNSDSMDCFKTIKFHPDDILTIHDSKGIITNGYCYSSDGYDGFLFKTITFDSNGRGTLYFSDLKSSIINPQINDPQWQVSNITYGYNTENTIRIDFILVNNSSSDPSDTPSSETGSESASSPPSDTSTSQAGPEAAPSTPSDTSTSQTGPEVAPSAPSHQCNFQWVTTVEPQPNADGLEEYKCIECGAVQEQKSLPASMTSVKNLFGFVKDVPENGTVTTDFGRLHTISDYLLKKMAERNDATVIIQFEYKNQKLQITFPAGTDYTPVLNDTETMYGFYGIAAKLGLSVTECQ